jgi:hypothetical protein
MRCAARAPATPCGIKRSAGRPAGGSTSRRSGRGTGILTTSSRSSRRRSSSRLLRGGLVVPEPAAPAALAIAAQIGAGDSLNAVTTLAVWARRRRWCNHQVTGVMPDIAAGFAATIEAARRYPGTRDLLLLATFRTGRRLPRRHTGWFRALACIDRRDHHVIPSQETAATSKRPLPRPRLRSRLVVGRGHLTPIAIQPSASIPASSRRKPAIEIRKQAGSRLNIIHSQRLAAEQAQQHPRWTKVTPGLRADTHMARG